MRVSRCCRIRCSWVVRLMEGERKNCWTGTTVEPYSNRIGIGFLQYMKVAAGLERGFGVQRPHCLIALFVRLHDCLLRISFNDIRSSSMIMQRWVWHKPSFRTAHLQPDASAT